jgi:hypothetical protein
MMCNDVRSDASSIITVVAVQVVGWCINALMSLRIRYDRFMRIVSADSSERCAQGVAYTHSLARTHTHMHTLMHRQYYF